MSLVAEAFVSQIAGSALGCGPRWGQRGAVAGTHVGDRAGALSSLKALYAFTNPEMEAAASTSLTLQMRKQRTQLAKVNAQGQESRLRLLGSAVPVPRPSEAAGGRRGLGLMWAGRLGHGT